MGGGGVGKEQIWRTASQPVPPDPRGNVPVLFPAAAESQDEISV